MYTLIGNPGDYRAALYIRLSKEDDRDRESQSVTNQRSMLEAFAREHGLSVHGVYADDGYSGTSFDRPAFNRMMADIRDLKINMVITKDMSRLGRDYIQTGHYLEKFFPENRVRYISLLDGVDTGLDSQVNDITPFKAIMNDMYAKDISRKITSVKRDKQKKGLFIGGKAPYGYRLSKERKNALLVDDEAAGIVRLMFSYALEGASPSAIAARLTEQRVPPPAAYAGAKDAPSRWSAERVAFTLRNETYIGSMVQGRARKISYKIKRSVRLPASEWTVVKSTHEPLVSREVFDKVQMLMESRKTTRARTHDHPLKGLIRCAECGRPLGLALRPLAGGREALYFMCRTYQRSPKEQRCASHCVRADTVTAVVAERVRRFCRAHLESAACDELIAREAAEAGRDVCVANGGTMTAARVERLNAQLDRVYADKLAGVLDDSDFARIYQRIKEERAGLLAPPERPRDAAGPPGLLAEEVVERFLASAGENRELLVSLIERMDHAQDGELRIVFRFKQPGKEAHCHQARSDVSRIEKKAIEKLCAGLTAPDKKK